MRWPLTILLAGLAGCHPVTAIPLTDNYCDAARPALTATVTSDRPGLGLTYPRPLAQYYSPRSLRLRLSGASVIDCRVGDSRLMDCRADATPGYCELCEDALRLAGEAILPPGAEPGPIRLVVRFQPDNTPRDPRPCGTFPDPWPLPLRDATTGAGLPNP